MTYHNENKMEQTKTLTSVQFFCLSLSRTATLLKAGLPNKNKKAGNKTKSTKREQIIIGVDYSVALANGIR